MKTLISSSTLAGAALALGALTASVPAQAHSDVFFSIGLQVPGLYVQASPVPPPRAYYAPAPVYVAPAPVYYTRPWRGREFEARHWRHRGYGDLDRDGIANRFDRDRDGDGARNHFDRLPNNPRWR